MSFLTEIENIAFDHFILGVKNPGTCEFCKNHTEYIINTPTQTHYMHDQGVYDLCIECSETYTYDIEYMWAEYYSSLL